MMKSHTKRFLSFILALVLSFSLCVPAFAAGGFSDVPASHWAYDDIMTCAEAGIVTGMGDGKFHPGDEVTGTQFIVMLTRTFYSDEVAAVTTPAGQPWYYPNMEAAKNLQLTYRVESINDQPMSRYDMAEVLYNVSDEKDIPVDPYEFPDADKLKDFDDILGENHYNAVMSCYYFGVLTGMSDGTFSGSASMTRAQACAVIVRMMNLIGSEAPGQPEQPVQPTQPNQPQQTAGKLLNGEDATVENVVAMLKEIEQKYPTGTVWGNIGTPNNNTYLAPYATSKQSDFNINNSKIGGGKTSTMAACGGWAHQVSDLIFGISGAPCREVYSVKDARPGDILYYIRTSNNTVKHVAIITSVVKNPDDSTWRFSTCDGNVISEGVGYVSWNWDAEYGAGAYGMQSKSGDLTYRIFTRYPD